MKPIVTLSMRNPQKIRITVISDSDYIAFWGFVADWLVSISYKLIVVMLLPVKYPPHFRMARIDRNTICIEFIRN